MYDIIDPYVCVREANGRIIGRITVLVSSFAILKKP